VFAVDALNPVEKWQDNPKQFFAYNFRKLFLEVKNFE
jgi:hypothetical protein